MQIQSEELLVGKCPKCGHTHFDPYYEAKPFTWNCDGLRCRKCKAAVFASELQKEWIYKKAKIIED